MTDYFTLHGVPTVQRRAWRDYQDRAAQVFAKLGCAVSVDAKVIGARATHQVDVVVSFSRWGVAQIWIVECKFQKRRVTKAAVEALKSIVQDVGAEKGFLLSEVGFQPAAASAAVLTTLSLLSLAQLESGAAPDVQESLLALLEKETLDLMKASRDLSEEVERRPTGLTIRPKPGVEFPTGTYVVGSLVCLLSALQGMKTGDFNNAIPRSFPNDLSSVKLVDPHALLVEGFRLIGEIKTWLTRQQGRIQRANRLLKAIRRRNASKQTSNDAV